ncbi:hypothetical protein Bca52824_004628 [Brassica carinata]|uniref:Uncharacterized protein n=1 Tax=Brassica carinata TaxID=52824 RepID=A0A8X7WSD8_BRACI|nr:hypothetical protein Bca52824_004628 [Brassica carinata]
MIGTAIGPKGVVESEGEGDNYQKEMEKKKFDKEAQKLWLRMRNEVMTELQEKGGKYKTLYGSSVFYGAIDVLTLGK